MALLFVAILANLEQASRRLRVIVLTFAAIGSSTMLVLVTTYGDMGTDVSISCPDPPSPRPTISLCSFVG